MKLTKEEIAIVGPENCRVIDGQCVLNAIGVHRLADAVISGRIEGNPEAARELKKFANATVQATSRLN